VLGGNEFRKIDPIFSPALNPYPVHRGPLAPGRVGGVPGVFDALLHKDGQAARRRPHRGPSDRREAGPPSALGASAPRPAGTGQHVDLLA